MEPLARWSIAICRRCCALQRVRLIEPVAVRTSPKRFRQYTTATTTTTTSNNDDQHLPKFDILFCGSDAFSAESLKAVLRASDTWRSLRVLVPLEKRKGRLKAETPPEAGVLALLAEQSGLEVDRMPTEGISAYQLPEPFTSPQPTSLLVTASFGHILPNTFLSSFLPTHGLNVHPSLLPRWRGAAPIQWTIASGDTETGVVVQRLVEKGKGIDAGEIVGSKTGIAVPRDATYPTLLPVLAETGGAVLVDVLRKMQEGEITGHIQDPAGVTRAPKITEKTASIQWEEQSAEQLDMLRRGISHQEPLWTIFQSYKLQLIHIAPCDPPPSRSAVAANINIFHPRMAVLDRKGRFLRVACKSEEGAQGVSWIRVKKVKPAGRKSMDVMEWWNGLPKGIRMAKYIEFGYVITE